MRFHHFWPPNDIYFGVGAAGIIEEVSLITIFVCEPKSLQPVKCPEFFHANE